VRRTNLAVRFATAGQTITSVRPGSDTIYGRDYHHGYSDHLENASNDDRPFTERLTYLKHCLRETTIKHDKSKLLRLKTANAPYQVVSVQVLEQFVTCASVCQGNYQQVLNK